MKTSNICKAKRQRERERQRESEREFCDSKLSDLHAFDNMAIIH